MRIFQIRLWCALFLFCAAACVLQPVLAADNGTITIAYRGYGGRYVGDTIIFDGKDTYGSTVLLKIAGVGLPSEGVPLNNLNGQAGTATSVAVDQDGTWKYVWFGASAPGITKMQTARYVFTVTDSANPDKTASTFLSLKKPEYSVKATPNPVKPGEYIMLTGTAEKDISFVKISITDPAGTVVHTYTAAVTASGDFSYNFHVNMDPGEYTVTVSNPALKAPFGTVITVIPDKGSPVTPVMTLETTATPAPTDATPVPSTPKPTQSPISPISVIVALAGGFLVVAMSHRR